ncbi:MAG: VTT domain-containing protein [Rhodobacteraceae bacterium]|nr:VTT domain-containing protein [Paracoccaceae bacterium]
MKPTRTLMLELLFAALVIAALLYAWRSGLLASLQADMSRSAIEGWVAGAGLWGPVVVVALMTIAVVASPIPSAPIALAAGAAYGHTAGTIYIVIGAEAGALIAFGLSRLFGRKAILKWFGSKADFGLLGSQNALTITVLASRLMPFVSFDLVSYAAGLSALHFWRFALATLAGIIPASFLLAHFGGEVASGDMGAATWGVLGLGLITGAPLLWAALRRGKS